MALYDLGPLTGSGFYQYTNSAGQVYYLDMATNAICYSILPGFGDNPNVCHFIELPMTPRLLTTR